MSTQRKLGFWMRFAAKLAPGPYEMLNQRSNNKQGHNNVKALHRATMSILLTALILFSVTVFFAHAYNADKQFQQWAPTPPNIYLYWPWIWLGISSICFATVSYNLVSDTSGDGDNNDMPTTTSTLSVSTREVIWLTAEAFLPALAMYVVLFFLRYFIFTLLVFADKFGLLSIQEQEWWIKCLWSSSIDYLILGLSAFIFITVWWVLLKLKLGANLKVGMLAAIWFALIVSVFSFVDAIYDLQYWAFRSITTDLPAQTPVQVASLISILNASPFAIGWVTHLAYRFVVSKITTHEL